MAKKKTRRTTTRRRSRGIGRGSIMSNLTMAASAVVGGVAANMLQNTFLQGKDPKIVAGATMGLGVILAAKSKNPLLEGLGLGMATVGANQFAQNLGIIKGIGEMEYYVPISGAPGYVNQYVAGPAAANNNKPQPTPVCEPRETLPGYVSEVVAGTMPVLGLTY